MRQGNGYVAIEDSAAPIYDREQQVIGAVMVFRDVSERYRDEFGQRLLRTLHNQLATTIDLAQVLETSTAVPTPSFSVACGLYLLLDAAEELHHRRDRLVDAGADHRDGLAVVEGFHRLAVRPFVPNDVGVQEIGMGQVDQVFQADWR